MKTIKNTIALGWTGWAKVMLGVSRLAFALFQASSGASYSADKRARRLGVGK